MQKGSTLAALEALYERRLDDFVRTATAITGAREVGRDAVHDAFVSLIRKHNQFHGEGALEAWVWRTVVRAALKARARSAHQDSGERLAVAGPLNGHAPELAELSAAIALLPERQRLIVFLRYYADLDYQQIAQALGLRRGTVSAALHTAHQTLRRRLEEVVEQ